MEKVTKSGITTYRHYVQAPTGVAALYLRRSGGTPTEETYYLTHDHLGSTDRVINAAGTAIAVAESFDAYGRRRNGGSWTGSPSAPDLTAIGNTTRDAFTSHEQLDNLNLIHMNGRVFDPVVGRFMSADPFIDWGLGTQGVNRYGYVGNNPLTLIDPSGYGPCEFTTTCINPGVGYPRPYIFGGSLLAALAERNAALMDFQEQRAARAYAVPPVTTVNISLLWRANQPPTMYGTEAAGNVAVGPGAGSSESAGPPRRTGIPAYDRYPWSLDDVLSPGADFTYEFSQSTGNFTVYGNDGLPDLIIVGGFPRVWSGYMTYANDPKYQDMVDLGTIPRGLWIIGQFFTYKKMENSFWLYPVSANDVYKTQRNPRSFLCHGGSSLESSTGCLILPPDVRREISRRGGGLLYVKP